MSTPAANEQANVIVPPQFDPTAITTAIAEGFKQAAQTNTEGRETEMTPEQKAQYFQQWDPTQDGFVDTFHNVIVSEDSTPEQRAQALGHMRDGIVNQALRGAELMIQQHIGQIDQRYAPALNFAQKQQAEQVWNQFQTDFPELKDHRELVDTVSNSLRLQPDWKPANAKEALSSIAETAKKFITAGVLPTGGPPAPAVKTPGSSQKPTMATTSVTPAGGTPANTQPQTAVASFFLNRNK